MRNLKIYKNEEDSLYFILSQFVTTHDLDKPCANIFRQEIDLSERLIKELNVEFAKQEKAE